MNFRTTLVLLCVLIAVGIIVVITQHKDLGTNGETPAATTEKLFSVTQPDLTKISFADDAGQPITLEKNDFKWSLTSPVKGPADDTAVQALLSAIVEAESRGKVDAGPATGLDSATRKVELTTKQNQTIAFDVGSRSATGEVVYIRRQGQSQADVVAASLADALDKPLKEWRRAKLLDVGATEIRQLHIASTQPTVDLQKQGDQWQMTQPTTEPVDTIAVSDLTAAAANLRAEEFVSDTSNDAAQYGLDHPVLTVVFSTAGVVLPPATAPATQTVATTIKFGHFGDVLKQNVYAEVSTQLGVFKVPTTALTAFHKTPLELRDKKLTTIDPATVTRIEIVKDQAATTQPTTRLASTSTTILQIRPKPTSAPTTLAAMTAAATEPATTQAATEPATTPSSKWAITTKNDEPADDGKIETLLAAFHPLRVDRFEESPAVTPAVDTYTLTLRTGDRSEVFKLTDSGSAQPLRGEYGGLNFVVPREMIDSFDRDFSKSAVKPMRASPTMMPGMMPPGMQ